MLYFPITAARAQHLRYKIR